MSQFIHHVWEKPLLFMLILAGHDERRFSLQINITKDITSMVQWVKAFSMTSFLCILLLVIAIGYCYWLLHFDSFIILVLTVNTQPVIACSGLAKQTLEQCVECVQGWQWRYQDNAIGVVLVSLLSALGMVGALFWCFCCSLWASKCRLGICNFNDKVSFN